MRLKTPPAWKGLYIIVSRRAGDLPEFWADAQKAEELLGWKAEKSIEDMCRDSWNFVNQ